MLCIMLADSITIQMSKLVDDFLVSIMEEVSFIHSLVYLENCVVQHIIFVWS